MSVLSSPYVIRSLKLFDLDYFENASEIESVLPPRMSEFFHFIYMRSDSSWQ